MMNKKNDNEEFTQKDLFLLQSIAAFVSISLQHSTLKELSPPGACDAILGRYATEDEQKQVTIAARLTLSPDEQQKGSSIDFSVRDWDGIQCVKLLFFIFHKFDLLETFQLTNARFFKFIFALRNRYNDLPSHNWEHAIDVIQFLSCLITSTELGTVLTSLELLTIFIAAIAHDVNHDGFSRAHTVKANIALGLLFKEHSMEEMVRCRELMTILDLDEFDLFHTLGPAQISEAWTLLIGLMSAIDMRHHFQLVSQYRELAVGMKVVMRDPGHRLLVMQIFLKMANVGWASRSFALAEKSWDETCEAVLTEQNKYKFTGDGMKQNKAKMLVAFYNFMCLPMQITLAHAYPSLETILVGVRRNLEACKIAAEPRTANSS
jgi:hypothetical protein